MIEFLQQQIPTYTSVLNYSTSGSSLASNGIPAVHSFNQDVWSILSSDQSLKVFQTPQDEVQTDFLKLAWDTFVYALVRLRFLFYITWPSDVMFSSLEEVPRYVSEVSSQLNESE